MNERQRLANMNERSRLSGARTHFELFTLPARFTLDRQLLESRYLQLTRETHPDLAGTDPAAQLAAMQLSAQVNEAYATLRRHQARPIHPANPWRCRL